MGDFFALLWLATIVGAIYFGIGMVKGKLNKKTRFAYDVSKKVFVIALSLSLVSFIGIGMTMPSTEEDNNNINSGIVENASGENNNSEVENIANQITNETTKSDISHKNETSNESKNETTDSGSNKTETSTQTTVQSISLSSIPKYNGKAYVSINNNVPFFTETDLTTTSYEKYSKLDSLGRCGVAIASVGKDLMPTEERGNIGSVKPTGWNTVKYKGIDGNYLYNRCHLIGYQLSGENANEKNLITGTRYMNVEGMLPFENMVADYVKETNNHVLYRVTPMFDGKNLLVSGVLIEAKSVEDNGKGIQFNVYCYNVQPGIEINYKTGASSGPEYTGTTTQTSTSASTSTNTNKNNSTSNSSTSNKNTSTNSNTNTSSSNKNTSTTTQSSSNKDISSSSANKDTNSSQTTTSKDTTSSSSSSSSSSSGGTYYFTPNGKSYHSSKNCSTLSRSKNILEGTLSEAIAQGKSDPCDRCN